MFKFDSVQYRKLTDAEEDVQLQYLWLLRTSEKAAHSNNTNSAAHRIGKMRGFLNSLNINNAPAVARRGATQ